MLPRVGTVLCQQQETGTVVTQQLLLVLWRREPREIKGIPALGGCQQALEGVDELIHCHWVLQS